MLEIGMKAPDFSLPDQNGTVHTLEEYRGKKVVLYFYPKDSTAGCILSNGMTVFSDGRNAIYPGYLKNSEEKLAREQRKLSHCQKGIS